MQNFTQTKNIIKKEFSFKIAYIGRLTLEKNIQPIIDGVNLFNRTKKKK